MLGFLRGLGMAILFAILTFLGNAVNLGGIFSPVVAGIIASAALAWEHSLAAASTTGKALFGLVRAH